MKNKNHNAADKASPYKRLVPLISRGLLLSVALTGCGGIEGEDNVDMPQEEIGSTVRGAINYRYKIVLNNRATARRYKIQFRCRDKKTEKNIDGSSFQSRVFDCSEPPVDSQDPYNTQPDIRVKFKAKVGFEWEKVRHHYHWGWANFGQHGFDASTKDWVYWYDFASDTSGPNFDEEACFGTWEFGQMRISSESCHDPYFQN